MTRHNAFGVKCAGDCILKYKLNLSIVLYIITVLK